MTTPKLSAAAVKVLGHLAHGRPAHYGCHTKSQYGGLSVILVSLHRKGLIDRNGLTAAGRIALNAAQPSVPT